METAASGGGRETPALAVTLGLAPHPEGGWFRETWRSGTAFTPPGYPGSRASATAILFLLAPGEESRWHRVRSAELWFWHAGGPLLLGLGGAGDTPRPDGTPLRLGPDVAARDRPQGIVPAGTWQSARPAGDREVLVSCVVSPGFDFADFELA